MIRYFVLAVLLIGASFSFLYFRVGVLPVHQDETPARRSVYYYDMPERSFENITVRAYYFVPQNKIPFIKPNWKESLGNHLSKLKTFHEFQFQGRSSFNFIVYPEPIIGINPSSAYDAYVPVHGDTRALHSVALELDERVLKKSGDLYDSEFLNFGDGSNSVSIIMYEGNGSAGDLNIALISSGFLTRQEYVLNGTTLLAHEFFHALGVREGFDILSGKPITEDIMGASREKSFEASYISYDSLNHMGL